MGVEPNPHTSVLPPLSRVPPEQKHIIPKLQIEASSSTDSASSGPVRQIRKARSYRRIHSELPSSTSIGQTHQLPSASPSQQQSSANYHTTSTSSHPLPIEHVNTLSQISTTADMNPQKSRSFRKLTSGIAIKLSAWTRE